MRPLWSVPGVWSVAGLVLLHCLLTSTAFAGRAGDGLSLELNMDAAVRDGLEARGLRSRLEWTANGAALEVRAEKIRLPEPVGELQQLRLKCPELRLSASEFVCDRARIWGEAPALRLQGAPIGLRWDRDSGDISVTGSWPGWFGARGDFRAELRPGRGWDLRVELSGIELPELVRFERLPLDLPLAVERGVADLTFRRDGAGHVDAALEIRELTFSDELGLRAGEALRGDVRIAGDRAGWNLDLAVMAGMAFVDPWFVDVDAEGPVRLSVEGVTFDAGHMQVQAETLALAYGDAMKARGRALAFDPEAGLDGVFEGEIHRLGVIYTSLLSPLLAGTPLGDLEAAGHVVGELELRASQPQSARLDWSAVEIQDRGGRFGMSGGHGELAWSGAAPGRAGRVAFASAHLYELPLDTFAARLRMRPRGVELLEVTELPVLDGAIRIGSFRLRQTPRGPDVQFEGGIRAISLEPLTEVLGWPRFSGRVAGMIPRVRLEDGDLNVEGRLLVQLFDGDVVMRDVYIHELFGHAPELGLSTQINRLDLELITRAFDVGRIQGRLSGEVEDLVMVDWSPVHMDLDLRTPSENPGRRRISQRAVEDIAELGGGLQAAASSIFLRLFEDFSYRRLGFRCELRDEVCTASGVADRDDGGFVLVQGGGLPQIRVIGYNRRIDWPELVARLAAIQAGEGAVVQ